VTGTARGRPSGTATLRTALDGDSSLRSAVVDALGRDIVSDRLQPGDVVSADVVCQRFGVSRTIARESLRELESLGMVNARPQVGTVIRDRSGWNHFHPRLINWRGQFETGTQLREVLEIRAGVEPVAAGLAAQRISDDEITALNDAYAGMVRASDEGDDYGYLRHDAELHRLLYTASRNAMLSQFTTIVAAVLHTRLYASPPPVNEQTPRSLALHANLIRAVTRHQPTLAERAARKLVTTTMNEAQH
jgi:DNA-binding FadR family transcriptional regulator